MPKLNAVLMVVLTLATIAGAGYVVLKKTPPAAEDPAAARKLLRKLADSDPDVRREAESGLKALGPRALPSLRDAAGSSDKVLADRASKLVREMEAAPVAAGDAKVREESLPVEVPVEFVLECPKPSVRIVDGSLDLRIYVRLVNRGSSPLLLARDEVLRYARFAHFEVAAEGAKTSVAHNSNAVEKLEVVVVQPGETLDLGLAQGDGCPLLASSLCAPGSYKVRFVYDATEGSLYRKLVKPSPRGALLPPARLVSAPVTIDVVQ